MTINFLTDDPWNPAHRAPWFLDALREYDAVFTPRRANIRDLEAHGCRNVDYLPFGFCPEVHFPAQPYQEKPASGCDVIFAGGADPDRMPYVRALCQHGIQVGLYGGYWDRDPVTRPYSRGFANWPTLRKAMTAAKIALCLVRRANRDGHSMRSFEVPAMRVCMLAEDTDEHRELLGHDGQGVTYFRSVEEMIEKARWLLDHPEERDRRAAAVFRTVSEGRHCYRDRLQTMLARVSPPAGVAAP